MQTDVKAKNMTATGASGVGTTRIKAISFVPVAGGAISIKDGGAGGTELLKLDVAAASTSYLSFPEDGIRFNGDPYVTLTTVTSVTFFYG